MVYFKENSLINAEKAFGEGLALVFIAYLISRLYVCLSETNIDSWLSLHLIKTL